MPSVQIEYRDLHVVGGVDGGRAWRGGGAAPSMWLSARRPALGGGVDGGRTLISGGAAAAPCCACLEAAASWAGWIAAGATAALQHGRPLRSDRATLLLLCLSLFAGG